MVQSEMRTAKMRSLIPILTALLIVSGAVSAAATTVLALRQGDEIIIAADSLRGLMRLETGERLQAESCKIRNFGDLVFAHAGRFLDASWNVDLLANSLRDSAGAPRQRAARFAFEVEASLGRVPRTQRREYNLSINYVIAFFEGGQPVLLDQTVRTVDGRIVVDPVGENPDGIIVMPGQTSFLDQDPEDVAAFRRELGVSPALLRSDPVAMLDFGIKYQAHLTPDSVGGPVDMIRMTANGARWVDGYRKSSCPESG